MKQRGQVVIDKILDTTDRLFYEQGYSNTFINQIIEEADIAKASLYKHFETKTDLLISYVQRTHQFRPNIGNVTNPKTLDNCII